VLLANFPLPCLSSATSHKPGREQSGAISECWFGASYRQGADPGEKWVVVQLKGKDAEVELLATKKQVLRFAQDDKFSE